MIKTIIFDVNGIVTSTDFSLLCADFAKRIGIDSEYVFSLDQEFLADLLVGTKGENEFFDNIEERMMNQQGNVRVEWIRAGIAVTTVNTELLQTITDLRATHTVGALTNVTPLRKMIDEALGTYNHFDYAVLSCEEGMKKPDPLFFRSALEKTSVKASEAIFIDDKEKYVLAAERLGINSILYKDNTSLRKKLKRWNVM